jgi:hypothetical protein
MSGMLLIPMCYLILSDTKNNLDNIKVDMTNYQQEYKHTKQTGHDIS